MSKSVNVNVKAVKQFKDTPASAVLRPFCEGGTGWRGTGSPVVSAPSQGGAEGGDLALLEALGDVVERQLRPTTLACVRWWRPIAAAPLRPSADRRRCRSEGCTGTATRAARGGVSARMGSSGYGCDRLTPLKGVCNPRSRCLHTVSRYRVQCGGADLALHAAGLVPGPRVRPRSRSSPRPAHHRVPRHGLPFRTIHRD